DHEHFPTRRSSDLWTSALISIAWRMRSTIILPTQDWAAGRTAIRGIRLKLIRVWRLLACHTSLNAWGVLRRASLASFQEELICSLKVWFGCFFGVFTDCMIGPFCDVFDHSIAGND